MCEMNYLDSVFPKLQFSYLVMLSVTNHKNLKNISFMIHLKLRISSQVFHNIVIFSVCAQMFCFVLIYSFIFIQYVQSIITYDVT